ncbi:MAG: GNAT family N-acetyltransferase, partial [Sulfuritalea sp.]|nr:GNAT family N-acetyltransferase [Sulfuritalea sp.]
AGERLVASRLLIRNESMWIILKTTYDESVAAIAPGRLLLQATLEYVLAIRPGARVEFYTNANRDQAEWATELRPISHHQILRGPFAAGLLAIARPSFPGQGKSGAIPRTTGREQP